MAKKKIGIVLDNFKVEEFKKNLIDNGYTEITETPFKDRPSTLTVLTMEVEHTEVQKLHILLQQLQNFFNARKFN